MTLATEWKFCSLCFQSFICENTHKISYKNLWNWHGNRNLMIFDLLPHPKVTSLTLGWKFYLLSLLLVIPVDLIYHMTMFEKQMTPWAPPVPLSPTPGAWPRDQNENSVWYVLYLSFVRTDTQFGIKIFEIDIIIEIKWYLTFWPLPRAPGGGAKIKFDVARPIHVSNSHTKFGWISSNGLGGDSITDRRTGGRTDGRTDRRTEAITISPSLF